MSEEEKKAETPNAEAKPAAAKPEPVPEKAPEPGVFEQYLKSLGIKAVTLGNNSAGMEMIEIEPKDLVTACTQLKKNKGMNYLCNMTSIELKKGYQIACQIENLDEKTYLIMKVSTPKNAASIPSLTSVYGAADWLEREAWDMMGISFEGHPNLTRILNPDKWDGHPLRKDYVGPTDQLNQALSYKK